MGCCSYLCCRFFCFLNTLFVLSAQCTKHELYCRIIAIAKKMPKIKDVKRKEQLKGSDLKPVPGTAMRCCGTAMT